MLTKREGIVQEQQHSYKLLGNSLTDVKYRFK